MSMSRESAARFAATYAPLIRREAARRVRPCDVDDVVQIVLLRIMERGQRVSISLMVRDAVSQRHRASIARSAAETKYARERPTAEEADRSTVELTEPTVGEWIRARSSDPVVWDLFQRVFVAGESMAAAGRAHGLSRKAARARIVIHMQDAQKCGIRR